MSKDAGSTNTDGLTKDFPDACDEAHVGRTANVVARYEADPIATQNIDGLILAHLLQHETTRRDRTMAAYAREERIEAINNHERRIQNRERGIPDFGDSEINLCAEIEEQTGMPQQAILGRIDALASQHFIHFDEVASSDCGQTILRAGPPPNGCATFRRTGGFWVRSAFAARDFGSNPSEPLNAVDFAYDDVRQPSKHGGKAIMPSVQAEPSMPHPVRNEGRRDDISAREFGQPNEQQAPWEPPPGYVGAKTICNSDEFTKNGRMVPRTTLSYWAIIAPPKNGILHAPDNNEAFFPTSWVRRQMESWSPRELRTS